MCSLFFFACLYSWPFRHNEPFIFACMTLMKGIKKKFLFSFLMKIMQASDFLWWIVFGFDRRKKNTLNLTSTELTLYSVHEMQQKIYFKNSWPWLLIFVWRVCRNDFGFYAQQQKFHNKKKIVPFYLVMKSVTFTAHKIHSFLSILERKRNGNGWVSLRLKHIIPRFYQNSNSIKLQHSKLNHGISFSSFTHFFGCSSSTKPPQLYIHSSCADQ